jgi:plasmid stabilization system protein ParE
MGREIILTARASEEIEAASRWYFQREPGLDRRFVISMDNALRSIAIQPEIYPIRFGIYRRIILRKFPYAVYFRFDDSAVIVQSVFHESQHPVRLDRLRDSNF